MIICCAESWCEMNRQSLAYYLMRFGHKAVYNQLEKMCPIPLKVISKGNTYEIGDTPVKHWRTEKHYICPKCGEEILWDDLYATSDFVCPNCGQKLLLDTNTKVLLTSEYEGIYLKDKYGIPLSCILLSLLSKDEEKDGEKCSYCRYLWSA